MPMVCEGNCRTVALRMRVVALLLHSTGVPGGLCPISSRVVRMETPDWVLIKTAPTSASSKETRKVFIMQN